MQRYVKPCAPPIASIYPPIYNIDHDRYALPPLQTNIPHCYGVQWGIFARGGGMLAGSRAVDRPPCSVEVGIGILEDLRILIEDIGYE